MGFNEALARDLRDTTTFFNGNFDAVSVAVVICCTLALNSAVMLLLLIFTTFRRFRGLYFWSLVIASSAIIPYTIGFIIEYFQLTSQLAGLIITTYGWPAMVTGQSLVLYSRLGIVLGKGQKSLLKAVKWMVIVDAVVFHVTTTVTVFGAYYVEPGHHWMEAYKYVEKIQMTAFTLQEFIISGLYIWRTLEILKSTNPERKRTRKIMWQLCTINGVVILADVALLVVEYQDRHVVEQALKGAVYGIKLKLEFAILSKLIGITKHNASAYLGAFEDFDNSLSQNTSQSQSSGRPGSADDGKPLCRRCSKTSIEKRVTFHVERSDSNVCSKLEIGNHYSFLAPNAACEQPQPTYTSDERRRKRAIEEDFYAGICRDLAS